MKQILAAVKKFFLALFNFMPGARIQLTPVHSVKIKKFEGTPDPSVYGRVLKSGYSWNPMNKYPRNQVCWCGSGEKAKKCCLLRQPLAVPNHFAENAKPLIKTMRSLNG